MKGNEEYHSFVRTPSLVTPREFAFAQRNAFIAGALWFGKMLGRQGSLLDESLAIEESAKRYPLPKITRRRRVQDPHSEDYEWTTCTVGTPPRLDLVKLYKGHWENVGEALPTAERVKLWAELLAHPMEEVEDTDGPVFDVNRYMVGTGPLPPRDPEGGAPTG